MDFVASFFKKSKDKVPEPKKQMETNSPNKSINLFDKDISLLENSVLRPLRTDEICDFDESNSENHDIKPKVRFSVIQTLDPLLDNNHADIETSDKFDEFECLYPSSNNNFAQSLVEEYLDTALNEVHPHEVPVASDCLVNVLINNAPKNTAAKTEWNSSNETARVNDSLNTFEISQQSSDLTHSGSDQPNEKSLNTTIDADLITSLEKLRIHSEDDTIVHNLSENVLQENVIQSNLDTSKVFNQSDALLNELAAHQLLDISHGIAADSLEDISTDDNFDVSTNNSVFENNFCQASSTLNEAIGFNQTQSPKVDNTLHNHISKSETSHASSTIDQVSSVLHETIDVSYSSPSFDTTVIQAPKSCNETVELNQVASPKIENTVQIQLKETIAINLTTSETGGNNEVSKQLEFNHITSPTVNNNRAPIALEEAIEFESTIKLDETINLIPTQPITPKIEIEDQSIGLNQTVPNLNESPLIIENKTLSGLSTQNEYIELSPILYSNVETEIVQSPNNSVANIQLNPTATRKIDNQYQVCDSSDESIEFIQASDQFNGTVELTQSSSAEVENVYETSTQFNETIPLNQPSVKNEIPEISNQLNETICFNQVASSGIANNIDLVANEINETIVLNQIASPRVENDSFQVLNQLNETIELNQIVPTIQVSNELNETIGVNQSQSPTAENIISNQFNETIDLNKTESPRVENGVQLHDIVVVQDSSNKTCIQVASTIVDNIQPLITNTFNETDCTSSNTIVQSSFSNTSNETIDYNLSKVCSDSPEAQNNIVHGAPQLHEISDVEINTALPEPENNVATNQNRDLLNENSSNSAPNLITPLQTLENITITTTPFCPIEDIKETFSPTVYDQIEKQLDKIKGAALSKQQTEKQLSRVKLEKDITNSLSTSVHDQIEKQLNEINLNQTNPEEFKSHKPENNHYQFDKQSNENHLKCVNVENQIAQENQTNPESVIDHITENQQLNCTNSVIVDSLEDIPALLSKQIEPKLHMSETTSKPSSHLCETNVASRLSIETNATSTHTIGEVIKQNDCFDKQTDIVNGAEDCKAVSIDNNKSLEDKSHIHNEMMERLTNAETECEKCKVQIVELKKELKTCRQKVVSRESELADLTRRENELMILVEDFKNKKSNDTTDSKEVGNELLRANETALKNEIQELKGLIKQLENNLRDMQRKEAKLSDDLNSKTQTEMQISRVMEEYEKSISSLVADNEKMKNERDTAQMHLANIEMAFSDVHQKYERCKTIIQGFKENEESLKQDISTNEETILKQEQKYEALKAHAMAQLEKSNQELAEIKRHHDQELARVTAQLKRYEIKNNSLMEALTQKSKECEQLSAVCDEFIGNV